MKTIILPLCLLGILTAGFSFCEKIAYKDGYSAGLSTRTETTITKEVSVIKEEQDCKKLGGEFTASVGVDGGTYFVVSHISDDDKDWVASLDDKRWVEGTFLKDMTCKKVAPATSKTLFKYEF